MSAENTWLILEGGQSAEIAIYYLSVVLMVFSGCGFVVISFENSGWTEESGGYSPLGSQRAGHN